MNKKILYTVVGLVIVATLGIVSYYGKGTLFRGFTMIDSKNPVLLVQQFDLKGVSLEWKDTNVVDTYMLYRHDGDIRNMKYLASNNDKKFTDTSVEASQTYFYVVNSVKAGKTYGTSNTVKVTLPGYMNPGLRVSEKTNKTVKLEWNDETDSSLKIEEYIVYRTSEKRGIDMDKDYLSAVSPEEKSYTDVTILPGEKYFYQVVSTNEKNEIKGKSNIVETEIGGLFAPTLSVGTISNQGVQLSWKDETDINAIEKYEIYRSEEGNVNASFILETQKTYLDKEIKPGKTYSYFVKSTTKTKKYFDSNTVTATIPGYKDISLYLIEISKNGGVQLGWSDATDPSIINEYVIYRATGDRDINFDKDFYEGLDSQIKNFTDTKAERGKIYTYKIVSTDLNQKIAKVSNKVVVTIPIK